MKHVFDFNSYLNESQSKKIKQYITFSTVMTWYRENKEKIAKILKIDPSELTSEDEILTQSYGLVNHVINRQSSGNDGNINRAGFSEFQDLEKNLIHDILHNLYQVQAKHFDKSLDRVEYTESEFIEEIECLGIEESFMKYMNITYPKTDFINQNINMLVSHMMLSILKHDTQRIIDIITEKVEPYLEVYGKQYPTKGTAFEGVFSMLNFWSENQFREELIEYINVGEGIDMTNGDRGQYPDGDYFGTKRFGDLDEYEKDSILEDAVLDNTGYHSLNFITVKFEDDNGDDEIEFSEINKPNVVERLRKFFKPIDSEDEIAVTDEDIYGKNPNQMKIDFDKRNESMIFEKELETAKFSKYNNIVGVLDYAGFVESETDENFEGIEDKIDEIYVVGINGDKYLIFDEDGHLLTKSDVFEKVEEWADDRGALDEFRYDNDHRFIDFDSYRKLSTEDLVKHCLADTTSRNILRRMFRKDDIVRNNTSLGQKTEHDDDVETVDNDDLGQRTKSLKVTKNSGTPKEYVYFDFEGEYSFNSISKNLMTDNAKNLYRLLSELRGHVIKNFDKIKANTKDLKNKFTNDDIDIFRNINISEINSISDSLNKFNYSGFEIEFDRNLRSYDSNNEMRMLYKVANAKKAINLVNKIENKDELDYLFNWVNKGNIKNYADFEKLKTILNNPTFQSKIKDFEEKVPADVQNVLSVINKMKKSPPVTLEMNIQMDKINTEKDFMDHVSKFYKAELKKMFGKFKKIAVEFSDSWIDTALGYKIQNDKKKFDDYAAYAVRTIKVKF